MSQNQSLLSQQSIEKYLPKYSSSLCGLASVGNAINLLKADVNLTSQLLSKIYSIVETYNQKQDLHSFTNEFQNPNPWRVFTQDLDIYHSALMTIIIAFDLKVERFEASDYTKIDNPQSTSSLVPYLNPNSKIIISVKSNFSLSSSAGSHLVLLDSFDNQDTKTFNIFDPYNPNSNEADNRKEINSQFLDTYFRGTGIIISNQTIPKTDIIFTPIMESPVPTGTKPWPVFIPKEVVEDIRKLLK